MSYDKLFVNSSNNLLTRINKIFTKINNSLTRTPRPTTRVGTRLPGGSLQFLKKTRDQLPFAES
jgi:hypothetical protein